MGDTGEGPSSAAQRAPEDEIEGSPGLWSRLRQVISPAPSDETHPQTTYDVPRAAGSVLGMLNLRRMRVEDVSIPKPDIVAVPVTISKEELVEVFRESGLTRLPVYDGTLDTPLGVANLKDFALKHGKILKA